MNIHYSRTRLPTSIFLAGPTPRSKDVKSWRPEAISLFEEFQFDGDLLVPEDSKQSWAFSYDDQIEWELQALHSATVVMFWVPREIQTMPAFTTNVEFGLFAPRRNVVLGSPDGAEKMKYLQGVARLYSLTIQSTLRETVKASMELAQRPFQTS